MCLAGRPTATGKERVGLAEALWWAYEHAPAGMDTLFQGSRRHLMPILRHRLLVRRFIGPTAADGATATVLTTGGAMTLDFLVEKFFRSPPQCEPLGKTSLLRMPKLLETLAPSADLVLACVPRAFAGWFGNQYLRVPALVSARLQLGDDVTSTLVHATRTVRYEARQARGSGYSWSLSNEMADFERFYDQFYRPFVERRFGHLAVVREREVLRRHFRLDGGIIWLAYEGAVVAGELVHMGKGRLAAMVEALAANWQDSTKPSTQFMLKFADCDLALRHGLTAVDFGGSLPSLMDGPLRSKRAWGATFNNAAENHREILLRWQTPLASGVRRWLADVPLLFDTPKGFCAVSAGATLDRLEPQQIQGLRHRLLPKGVTSLFLFDGAAAATSGVAGSPVEPGTHLLDPMVSAAAIHRMVAALS